MTDSKSKLGTEILELLEQAEPHIEVGAALVGLLTEYVKKINDKVALKDLLMEIGKFFKSEVVPALEAVDAELFRQRTTDAEKWADIYLAISNRLNHLYSSEVALQMTLQMMRNSADTFRYNTNNISENIKRNQKS